MNKQLTIMIVEDEDLLLQAITHKFRLKEIETVSCTSGRQAIDYLSSMEAGPDVIWLDYYLKDMNGLEFMEQLRTMAKYSHTPVMVVSNSASDDKVKHMMALGANNYILKAEHRLDEIVDIAEKLAKGELGSQK